MSEEESCSKKLFSSKIFSEYVEFSSGIPNKLIPTIQKISCQKPAKMVSFCSFSRNLFLNTWLWTCRTQFWKLYRSFLLKHWNFSHKVWKKTINPSKNVSPKKFQKVAMDTMNAVLKTQAKLFFAQRRRKKSHRPDTKRKIHFFKNIPRNQSFYW